jgi:hypothetical protein
MFELRCRWRRLAGALSRCSTVCVLSIEGEPDRKTASCTFASGSVVRSWSPAQALNALDIRPFRLIEQTSACRGLRQSTFDKLVDRLIEEPARPRGPRSCPSRGYTPGAWSFLQASAPHQLSLPTLSRAEQPAASIQTSWSSKTSGIIAGIWHRRRTDQVSTHQAVNPCSQASSPRVREVMTGQSSRGR